MIRVCLLSLFSFFIQFSIFALPKITPGNILLKLESYFGPIYIELNKKADPVSVNHLMKYVDQGFYNGLIFHRIIDGFVIQTGSYQTDFIPRSTSIVGGLKLQKNGLKNLTGTVAFARKRSDPDSATTHFFINLADNADLDSTDKINGFAVIGKVVEGLELVRKIARLKIGQREGLYNVPTYPKEAEIKSLSVILR